jgi:alpha-ribazole phosphatase/probable phosphoglycerate mutase
MATFSAVSIQVVFETHSTSEDNELGRASGWAHSRLSATGRKQAQELGARRRNDNVAAVFSSDLVRAVETAQIALGDSGIPVLLDWRLRECDYGDETQAAVDRHHATRCDHLRSPYPNGESWEQAIHRVGRFLDDLALRWTETRVLVIGHVATRWALDHLVTGSPLAELCASEFAWQEGWEYELPGHA